MMIGACQSTIRGARAFAVDLIEVIRRTIVDLFEMDSVNVSSFCSNADIAVKKRGSTSRVPAYLLRRTMVGPSAIF